MSLKYKKQHETRRNINQTHNPKVEGSNPSPATNLFNKLRASEKIKPRPTHIKRGSDSDCVQVDIRAPAQCGGKPTGGKPPSQFTSGGGHPKGRRWLAVVALCQPRVVTDNAVYLALSERTPSFVHPSAFPPSEPSVNTSRLLPTDPLQSLPRFVLSQDIRGSNRFTISRLGPPPGRSWWRAEMAADRRLRIPRR